jgi:hypothetical protein
MEFENKNIFFNIRNPLKRGQGNEFVLPPKIYPNWVQRRARRGRRLGLVLNQTENVVYRRETPMRDASRSGSLKSDALGPA